MDTIQNNIGPNVLYLNNFETTVIDKDAKPDNTCTVLKIQGKLKVKTNTY